MLYDFIQYLPDEIITIIWNNINPVYKIFLNKENYYKFNYLISTLIIKGRYESYIRDIIRNDYIFIFKNILQDKLYLWIQPYDYKYKNIVYNNYVEFLLFYSNKNNSYKCYTLIKTQLELSGFKKKQRKNNKLTYNKWSN